MRRSGAGSGQVVVEMILILPVFLGIVFSIMEIGYVSFHVIVLNHATYEVARIGSMTAGSASAGACPPPSQATINGAMAQILPKATVTCAAVATLQDPQALQMNCDLQCTSKETVSLIFPISSIMLSDPGNPGHKTLTTSVAMPIERALLQ